MCHSVRVKLSLEERTAVKRLAGYLVPAYAVIAVAIIALAAISSGPPTGTLVASSPATNSALQPAER